ncbi:hypothetical protein ACWD2L_05750 [Streptomyces sp. NPDC002754]
MRLRGWKVTSDGTFWGGVVALLTWGSVIGILLYTIVVRTP